MDEQTLPASVGRLSSEGLGCNAQAPTRERPILFAASMVRAILAGTKTQTRRVIRGAHDDWAPMQPRVFSPTVVDRHGEEQPGPDAYGAGNDDGSEWVCCPYGPPGDRLWVKETHHTSPHFDCLYRADYEDGAVLVAHGGWKPSIFMPRRLSRITLEITGVRVERLQAISEADALAEGSRDWAAEQYTPVRDIPAGETRLIYMQLWESINGAGSWDANPWVWVVEFRRLLPLQPNDRANPTQGARDE